MPKFDKNQYSLKEVYNFYKSKVSTPVSYKMFKIILDRWGDKVVENLLLGKDVRLHSGLSVLQVRKVFHPVYMDFKASKEQQKMIKKSNVSSSFYGAKIRWRRHYTKINSSSWSFEPTRSFSRALSRVMKMHLGHTRFLEKAKVTVKPKLVENVIRSS